MARPPEVDDYLHRAVVVARAALGESLTAVYTTGSLALDGYVQGRSDIDLVMIAKDKTSVEARLDLAARLRHPELPCPATGLELAVTPESVAASGQAVAGFLLEFTTGPELPLPHMRNLSDDGRPRFWWVIDRAITRQAGEALFGPPAEEVIAEIGRADLMSVVAESIAFQLADIGEQLADSVLLNACRSLRYAEQGMWFSKPAAGAWALTRGGLDENLIRQALATHLRGGRSGAATLDAGRVGACLETVAGLLAAG